MSWCSREAFCSLPSLFTSALLAVSASAVTAAVSRAAAGLVPRRAAAPARAWTSLRSTRCASRQPSASSLSIASMVSLAPSRRANALLQASSSAASPCLSGCTRRASLRYADLTCFSSAGPPGSICRTSKACRAARMRLASSKPSAEGWMTPSRTRVPTPSKRSSSLGSAGSPVQASSCLGGPLSGRSTARTRPTPATTSLSPSRSARSAEQPLKACELFRISASSASSVLESTSCSSCLSYVWIFSAIRGSSFLWKFSAHHCAASALRRP
mmetsp:Transcript_153412/g.472004  ORF Transcript_153412/g.472004 Transcript_153412/m.472004 type:complete len:271 (+) Transcript_153412:853-1665(+)